MFRVPQFSAKEKARVYIVQDNYRTRTYSKSEGNVYTRVCHSVQVW